MLADSDEEPLSLLNNEKKKGGGNSKGSYGSVKPNIPRRERTDGNTFELEPEDLEEIMKEQTLTFIQSKFGGLPSLMKKLDTDIQKGLDATDDIQLRKTVFGNNTYPEAPPASWFSLFLESFEDVAVIILCVAAVVSLAAGLAQNFLMGEDNGWIEGVAIIVAVLLVATVSATNNYTKDLQFRELREQNKDRNIRVIRDGTQQVISIFELVVGDIAIINTGNKIPADGIYVSGLEDLMVDESSLTGEPDPKKKNVSSPFLFAECDVTRGSGQMLVLAVGEHSLWGRTLVKLIGGQDKKEGEDGEEDDDDDEEKTPLQEKLDNMVVLLGKIGIGVAVLTFLVLLVYYIIEFVVHPMKEVECSNNPFLINATAGVYNCSSGTPVPGSSTHILVSSSFDPNSLMNLLFACIVAITLVVVAVPEGLPLAVTISLAYSMKLMAKDQNLVRHLSACETMGGATTICSDKTGTLTENRMKVVQGWIAGKSFDLGQNTEIGLTKNVKNFVVQSCCLNNDDGTLERAHGKPIKFMGNTTECALLVFAESFGVSYLNIQSSHKPLRKWGFTSDRKRMSTLVSTGTEEEDGLPRLYIKGASEIVLKRCTFVLNKEGGEELLQEGLRSKLEKLIHDMASDGLRTLCLCYKNYDSKSIDWDEASKDDAHETDLVCIGVVGIEDPVRPEVPDSVLQCQRAGIMVRMVTGDNILTAKKIASDCHILTGDGICLEGPEFAKKSDDEIIHLLPKLEILARSSPYDKYRLVKLLMRQEEVVAVTGDGTNDAQALKQADVGLAMGIAGTEVAKNAADIIILDDNFASIVKSVMWGRCVYDNIRKFLQFQLTVNVVALVVAFVGAVSDYGTPLTAVQLLWVNLIMDTLAALALGTEKPTPDLLKRKPYGRSKDNPFAMISWIMWRNIFGQSLFQLSMLFAILYAVDDKGNHLLFPGVVSGRLGAEEGIPSVHYTMVFNTFVFMQVFNEINSRKVNLDKNVFAGILTNPMFCSIILFIGVVQAIIVEFGGQAIRTVPLDWAQWLYCVLIGYMALPWGFLLRMIPVPLEDWEKEDDDNDPNYQRL
eukprot:TRINITY_DN1891_c0_g1_i1.p2 TRINITY_DN1891_c0_g1~~TRINITY_DN1891_c0_g1_i1.p2  ORF type:complete len:1063 (-),score=295.26 TRINITY_DN1891_c0_g1_i1:3376-6564(-)